MVRELGKAAVEIARLISGRLSLTRRPNEGGREANDGPLPRGPFSLRFELTHPGLELILDPRDRTRSELDGLGRDPVGHECIPGRAWYTGFDPSIAFPHESHTSLLLNNRGHARTDAALDRRKNPSSSRVTTSPGVERVSPRRGCRFITSHLFSEARIYGVSIMLRHARSQDTVSTLTIRRRRNHASDR